MNDKRPRSENSKKPYIERNLNLLYTTNEKASLLGEDLSNLLTGMNVRLSLLADDIKANQGNAEGAVTLHLRQCGTKGCFGCPHPSFHRWFNPTQGRDPKQYTSEVVDKPLYYTRRNKRFDKVRNSIKEAQALMSTRTKLIKQTSSLNKCIIMINQENPDLIDYSQILDRAIDSLRS